MFRNLKRNRIYSFINISGLSIGITCSILILLWVFDELSFDKFLPKANRLYMLKANVTYDGRINTWGAAPLGAYYGLKPENNHIRNTATVDWGGEHLLTVGENKINKHGHFASEEFLTMFEFPLLKGNASQVLMEPGSIVISESTAKALFGAQDPINQLVRVDNQFEQKVSGVFKDLPKNSSFQFDCLLPFKLRESDPYIKRNMASWDGYSFGVYVELDDKASLIEVDRAIKDLPARHTPAADKGKTDFKSEFFLNALTDWRLHSRFENGRMVGGAIEYVRLFTSIAIFILVMACINFMNLATARSERRAKEVGIRKSVGSGKSQLIAQFIAESVFIAFIAFVISVLITQLLLPFYNDLVQKDLHINYAAPYFWIFAGTMILFTGLISGSYPAFYLSSFRPVQVLKGKVHTGSGASTPRKILVSLQFGFSILLIIGMMVIYQQVEYVKNRDMGFERANLITIKNTEEISKNYAAIKQELLQSRVVTSVTKSNNAITAVNTWSFLGWPGKPETQKVMFGNLATEFDYTRTMGIKLLAGRDFSEDFKSDSSAILINKAALDIMGLKDPIGQELVMENGTKRKLIGIMENAVLGSPEETMFPVFMEFNPTWVDAITVRLEKTEDLPKALSRIGDVFRKFTPAYPFEYTFADVEFQKKFSDITLIGRLANLFASLAIVITGLGLFGLASFTAEQRTKEIGIRKVLGASVTSLVALMSKDFSRLVLVAFLISAPIAWWALNQFLERHSYHIAMPWWVFPLTGFAALIFALLTVCTQALRTARANPVQTLRNE
jgi:putative ABC transport system permease protein